MRKIFAGDDELTFSTTAPVMIRPKDILQLRSKYFAFQAYSIISDPLNPTQPNVMD